MKAGSVNITHVLN